MSSVTWRFLSGDTSEFAIELALVTDATEDWMVDADERDSWGTLALWIGGVNVCEQAVQGETLQFAHWYLLPIAEWLVTHWDALIHEERLPGPNAGVNAARAFAATVMLAELDAATGAGFDRAEAVQTWYTRHGLRASAPGAILPDLYMRRYGDQIEFSTGTEALPGDDWGVVFPRQLYAVRVPVSAVADALGEAVQQLAALFVRRRPHSARFRALHDQVMDLRSPSREAERFAWLSGAGDRRDEFMRLWQQVHDAIPAELHEEVAQFDRATEVSDGLALLSAPAALLFGSLTPDVSSEDMVELYRSLLARRGSGSVVEQLRKIGDEVRASWETVGLTPGEQGSLYGEQAWQRLGDTTTSPVDIVQVIARLEINVSYVALQDRDVRAVSMVSHDGSACIVVNRNFRLGVSSPVERFTLAHELAHLLLDQGHASRMIVASGPWAPTEIEQRANAFAGQSDRQES